MLLKPPGARAMLALAHGAGAGMRHPFLENLSAALAAESIATLRYEFPYMELGNKRIDPAPVLEARVREAVRAAAGEGLPLFAGGKSMGGRMTSQAQAREPLPGVLGIVFFGFPLHAPRKPASGRAEHLARVELPILFLQGTRDDLASLDLLRPIVEKLPRATLHVIDGADHSFRMLKRSGRSDGEVIAELARVTAGWMFS
ncbi:MAG: alpha/beta hydrolase [Deltaproteobacteria bacterium]|nr:MAG: alpha/beta hydrolase [Deltaproteobacteria bacterium]